MLEVATAEDMQQLAAGMVSSLTGGEVIALSGELGAGKTVFAKGIALGLGITQVITSPTFVLMKVYPVLGHETVTTFCHIDAYRLSSGHDLLAVGADEYIEKLGVVTLIEWPERVSEVVPSDAIRVNIEIADMA